MSIWYYIAAEFKALGLWCIAHGPEFWLVAPSLAGVTAMAVIRWICRRNTK